MSILGALALTAALTPAAAVAASPPRGGGILEITQRSDQGTIRVWISGATIRTDLVSVSDGTTSAQLTPDGRLTILDPSTHSLLGTTIGAQLARQRSSFRQLARTQVTAALPRGRARTLPRTPARVRLAGGARRIAGVLSVPYVTRDAVGERLRVWYAESLGSASGPLARRLRSFARSGGGLFALGAAAGEFGHVVMEEDMLVGGRWVAKLRTLSVRHVRRFPFLRGRVRQIADSSRAARHKRPAFVPGFVVSNPNAQPVTGYTPKVYAYYWGSFFARNPAVVSQLNFAVHDMLDLSGNRGPHFADFLSEYGINQAQFTGYRVADDDPGGTVGSWNFLSVEARLFSESLNVSPPAPPRYWINDGGEPVIMVFVPTGGPGGVFDGWAGYHFVAYNEGTALGEIWPLSSVFRPGVPYTAVKVPEETVTGVLGEQQLTTGALDTTTESMSHEYAEATTDPFPFSDHVDPAAPFPPWENWEIADICSTGNTAPFAESTHLPNSSYLWATFWSQSHHACVPESRPQVHIDAPSAPGTAFDIGQPYTAHVTIDDPQTPGHVDPGGIQWTIDGTPVSSSGDPQRIPLMFHGPAASHVIAVSYVDRLGLSGSDHTTVLAVDGRSGAVAVSTSLGLSCPGAVQIGQPGTMTGVISPSGPTGAVTLTLTAPDGRTTTAAAALSPDGHYLLTSPFDQVGEWTVAASYAGDGTYAGSSATPCAITVSSDPQPTSVTLSCPSAPQFATLPFTCSGALNPAIAGETVTIRYTSPTGTVYVHTVTLDSDGSFTDQITPADTETGNWTVQARYPGDTDHAPASSPSVTVHVESIPG